MELLEYGTLVLLMCEFIPVVLLLFAYLGTEEKKVSKGPDLPITIVIPVRNEPGLCDLIAELRSQNYPKELVEIIVVNDHSTAEQTAILTKLQKVNDDCFRLISLSDIEQGKKAALTAGVKASRYSIILTTDADCSVGPDWLMEISGAMKNSGADLLFGSVLIRSERTALAAVQELEHFGFRAITQGSVAAGRPMLNTGANLCFRKDFFEKVNGFEGNEHISSGDDIFLLLKAKEGAYKMAGINTRASIVFTSPVKGFKGFFAQRFRWASKTLKFPDRTAFLTLMADLLIRLLCLGIPVFSALSGHLTWTSFSPLIVKLGIDFLLVFLASLQERRLRVLIWFIPTFLLTVVTQFMIVFWLISGKEVQWKDRVVSI